jgi:hypothetical protein
MTFFRFHSFGITTFLLDVAVYCCDPLKGIPCLEFVEVQVVEAKFPDSGSSSGNKSDNSPPHD